MKKLSLYIFLVLMWCNVGFALSLSDFFKTNTPSIELFGLKLLENINKYSKNKTFNFADLENIYGDDEIKDPYLKKIRWISVGDDSVVLVKNDNFDFYNLYVNDKLEIEGIDASNTKFNEDKKFQICLNKKTELIDKIVKLYDLNINNFKVQNYIFSNDDYPERKNDIISQSVFKFDYDKIHLSYGLACEIYIDKEESILWIELLTENLEVAIYFQNYSKTDKPIEQLLNSDLKGI